MPAYIPAIASNVGSVMASFSSVNGTKCHGDAYLLTDVLKKELGFKGFVVSDWAGINQLSWDYNLAVRTSINAGMDMVMVPDAYDRFISTLRVRNHSISRRQSIDIKPFSCATSADGSAKR